MGKILLSLPFKENFPRHSTSGSEFNTGRGSAAHKNVYKVSFPQTTPPYHNQATLHESKPKNNCL